MEGQITCPMCRSPHCDFTQNEDMARYMRENNVPLKRSQQEMGTVKLQFLYFLLVEDNHLVALNLDHNWNKVVFDLSLPFPPADRPGLSDDLAKELHGPNSDSDNMSDEEDLLPFRVGGVDNEFEEARGRALRRLRQRISVYWLKGDLKGLRFADDETQRKLVMLAPDYQNW